MALFLKYLHDRRRVLGMLGLFAGVFLLSFLLFDLPLGAVGYSILLCALVGSGFLAADFARVWRTHRALETMRQLPAAMMTTFPFPDSIEAEDYQAVIQALLEELAALKTESDKRYQDMVDYYTTWAHQIKTPIAAMDLKLQQEDSPLGRKLSADLSRIGQYVEMVMAFVRLDSPAGDYVLCTCSLDEIIRPAIRRFASEFIDRKIRLVYEPVTQSVITDEKWLGFVLEQLLSNALKYTPSGSIRIYMEEAGRLCIRDTGIGIAPEDLPRIFERGYTGYNGRMDKKASGIGLSLCRRVCDNLNIGLSIDSRPGEGTKVTLDLTQRPLSTLE